MTQKKVLAIVPARGGSKGIPLKNLYKIKGVPLVVWTVPIIKAIPEITRAVVSTDHPEIARVAKEAGLDVPFMRPASLSGDVISDLEVMTHVLQDLEKLEGQTYDVILLLPPTSPTRTPDHVRAVLSKLINENLDSVWTVSEADLKFHPLKALTIEEGRMNYFDERGSQVIARQQLKKCYYRNGAAYAFTRDCLLNQKRIMGKKSGAIVIHEPMVNIDTMDDIANLERLWADKK